MTITGERIKRRKAQKEKTKRRLTKSGWVVVGLSSVSALVLSGAIVYMYNQTKTWTKSSLGAAYADIPAEFVQDLISPDSVDNVEKLAKVQTILNKIEQDETIKDMSMAKSVVSDAKSVLEKLKISSGEAFENTSRLSDYISIIDYEGHAYTEPDTTTLQTLLNAENTRVLDHHRDIDRTMLKKLQTIVEDYEKVNSFLSGDFKQIGEFKDGTLTLKSSVTDLSGIMSQMSNLKHYPAIQSLYDVLSKSSSKALENNKKLEEQLIWLKSKTTLQNLSGDYVKLSDVKTLKDAKVLGYDIKEENKDGYELDETSPIKTFTRNEQVIDTSKYVKKTVKLTVTIDPKWKKIETSPSTSTSSSSSNNTNRPTPNLTNPTNPSLSTRTQSPKTDTQPNITETEPPSSPTLSVTERE